MAYILQYIARRIMRFIRKVREKTKSLFLDSLREIGDVREGHKKSEEYQFSGIGQVLLFLCTR